VAGKGKKAAAERARSRRIRTRRRHGRGAPPSVAAGGWKGTGGETRPAGPAGPNDLSDPGAPMESSKGGERFGEREEKVMRGRAARSLVGWRTPFSRWRFGRVKRWIELVHCYSVPLV